MTNPFSPAEQQRAVNLFVRDALVAAGWTLERDNEAGGSLVLTGNGFQIVGGFHAYERKVATNQTPVCTVCGKAIEGEAVFLPSGAVVHPNPEGKQFGWCPGSVAPENIVTAENLVPALPAGEGEVQQGWVIENEAGLWWDSDDWNESLNDGAWVYDNTAKDAFVDFGTDERFHGAKWVPIYAHEVDGCLTSEPCPGVNVCQDCLDVRRSAGENLPDDGPPIAVLAQVIEAVKVAEVTEEHAALGKRVTALKTQDHPADMSHLEPNTTLDEIVDTLMGDAPPKCQTCGGRHMPDEAHSVPDDEDDEPQGIVTGLPPIPVPQDTGDPHADFHQRSMLPMPSPLCTTCSPPST